MIKIAIIGAGKFGTAMANSLSSKDSNQVTLFTRSETKCSDINDNCRNTIAFPNQSLRKNIKASTEFSKLVDYDIVMIAIPSTEIYELSSVLGGCVSNGTVILNLSKGLMDESQIITDHLSTIFPQCSVGTMKGPTFATELVTGASSIFTLGYSDIRSLELVRDVLDDTNLYIDYTTDIRGVEILSVLKNIYAIVLGYIDAKYNSANTRFLVLTKAYREMRLLASQFGAHDDTINLACGYGDLGLTALNDLSRNRTLGLLMGKGFYKRNDHNVVLEGQIALKKVFDTVSKNILDLCPLLNLINSAFGNENGSVQINFDHLINRREKVVLTYGTFDLLHYGHLELLKRAKEFGSELIVGLSTDAFNLQKGKGSVHSYEKRKELLESLTYVSKVIPEKDWSQKVTDVIEHNVDIFIMGDDWAGKFDFLKEYCEVEYLTRTEGISSTDLKHLLNKN